MTSGPLILSIFPGIDGLGRGFEQEWPGACVVRGPDLLWGGDVRSFHPPYGVFDGVIGGPPCVGESRLAHLNGTPGVTMRDEFLRVVREAQPRWWVMEAVLRHDDLTPAVEICPLSPRWLGEQQSRLRYFHSNLPLRLYVDFAALEHPIKKHAVLAGHSGRPGNERMARKGLGAYSIAEMAELQGFPPDLLERDTFTVHGKRLVIGNAVPIPMARAIARAVMRALEEA